jgi:imidazole glycerol-phosphate synthase subunit HisH
MKNNRIVILDYNLGNLFSVKHACLKVGLNPLITSNKNDLLDANAIILPGVGAFGDAMKNLDKLDLISPIKDIVQKGIPLIGVCLGLHLLFEESEENGNNKGLGLIKGVIKRFPKNIENRNIKVPNIGWNTIFSNNDNKWNNSLLNNLEQNSFMYFVHSYYALPEETNDILTLTNYDGFEYCSSIQNENISAFQFHPEKSGPQGLEIYNQIKNKYYDTK